MNSRVMALAVIVLSAIAIVCLFALTWARLPERMATHFDAGGVADGWMSRNGYAWFSGGLFVFLVGILSGIGWLVPRLPTSLINLPNKEYWLDATRRASTLRAVQDMLLWFAAATSVFLALLLQLTIQTNRMADPRMPATALWLILGIYLAAVSVPGIVLYVRMLRTAR